MSRAAPSGLRTAKENEPFSVFAGSALTLRALPSSRVGLTIVHSSHTLKLMEKRFNLGQYGAQLWTREKARQIRGRLAGVLETLAVGDALIMDLAGVEVFDLSFAEELFGKTLLTLSGEYPGRFLIVENLTECTKENLSKGLESLNLAMIERIQGKLELFGKVHPADLETFAAVAGGGVVSAATLSSKLKVNLTAMNERLSKLTNLGLVRREKGSSASGREQYVYQVMR